MLGNTLALLGVGTVVDVAAPDVKGGGGMALAAALFCNKVMGSATTASAEGD